MAEQPEQTISTPELEAAPVVPAPENPQGAPSASSGDTALPTTEQSTGSSDIDQAPAVTGEQGQEDRRLATPTEQDKLFDTLVRLDFYDEDARDFFVALPEDKAKEYYQLAEELDPRARFDRLERHYLGENGLLDQLIEISITQEIASVTNSDPTVLEAFQVLADEQKAEFGNDPNNFIRAVIEQRIQAAIQEQKQVFLDTKIASEEDFVKALYELAGIKISGEDDGSDPSEEADENLSVDMQVKTLAKKLRQSKLEKGFEALLILAENMQDDTDIGEFFRALFSQYSYESYAQSRYSPEKGGGREKTFGIKEFQEAVAPPGVVKREGYLKAFNGIAREMYKQGIEIEGDTQYWQDTSLSNTALREKSRKLFLALTKASQNNRSGLINTVFQKAFEEMGIMTFTANHHVSSELVGHLGYIADNESALVSAIGHETKQANDSEASAGAPSAGTPATTLAPSTA